MKVVSLVVEGLEQAQQGGLFEWLHEVDADVICLQDTRCSEYSLKDDVFFPEAYNAYFLDDFENPTQNGVAIYCKQLPKAMMSGLGFADFDGKGLYLQADYNNVSIGSLLIPSGRDGEAAMNGKFKFMELLSQHLQKVRNKRRDFIICGGWELVANSIDAEEAGNRVDIPGFSDIEQGWLQSLYANGYCDAFRAVNPEPDAFTWWPDGDDAGGLRTDTQIVSVSLDSRIDRAEINDAEAFSNHAPIVIDYDLDL